MVRVKKGPDASFGKGPVRQKMMTKIGLKIYQKWVVL